MKRDKTKILRREIVASDLHVREASDDASESRVIEGYAIVFGQPSEAFYEDEDEVIRETIEPSAVTSDLLDGCDIRMLLFHDRHTIMARSNRGKGTLSYAVDSKGVSFSFEAPHTVDGDKAYELVKRGDISGCSFGFYAAYYDEDCVECQRTVGKDGRVEVLYRVKQIAKIDDFTLTPDPAYPATECNTREVRDMFGVVDHEEEHKQEEPAPVPEPEKKNDEKYREQVAEMRTLASHKISL